MRIKDILKESRTISCEFFPPREADGIDNVLEAAKRLNSYSPEFVSVTYGAGGSTQSFTEEITLRLAHELQNEVMAHLTCVSQTKSELDQVLQKLSTSGIDNIIALRGDPPGGDGNFIPVEGGFAHASDLIDHIRKNYEFGIAAACYPEGHTESIDLSSDIEYAKLKVDMGADFLVTQLFYDNEDFFQFMDRAINSGITVPIIPGVLPILSTPQIRRFTSMCGARIPSNLDKQLDQYQEDNRAVRQIGIEHATKQVSELWNSGVPGIHFYVLNRSYSISKILDNLNLPGHTDSN
ncbi:MAG: methylenetetrahydrofolate reductase [NAD(P)H] [Chloroflexota bacterium]|nr:methylenetetrahydrofolate reductase [NAD(P)H] [Chloroflexota bacterium]